MCKFIHVYMYTYLHIYVCLCVYVNKRIYVFVISSRPRGRQRREWQHHVRQNVAATYARYLGLVPDPAAETHVGELSLNLSLSVSLSGGGGVSTKRSGVQDASSHFLLYVSSPVQSSTILRANEVSSTARGPLSIFIFDTCADSCR